MRNYYRLMLGHGSTHAQKCFDGKFVGVDFGVHEDLKNKLPENWREFNERFIPVYIKANPDKNKRSAGLACATIWMVSKGIKIGDILLCPNGEGSYLVGEIVGDYFYKSGEILPHRREIKWYSTQVPRSSMSEPLQNSTGSIGTYSTIRPEHVQEVEKLIFGSGSANIMASASTDFDAANFAFERHLEDFLVRNWSSTELGKTHDLYEDVDEYGKKILGKQIPTDTGRIDILAISKNKKEFLVIELKNCKANDQAVGQVQRYMGYVLDEIAEEGQTVKGLIVAQEDDAGIRRALRVTQNVEFWKYEVSFKLKKF